MPEDIKPMPLEGPGSQSPQIPSLHTPVGQGAGTTGVNNVGKPQGLPGKPSGGLPAQPNLMKTPEELLDERSNDTLKKDLEDIIISIKESVPTSTQDAISSLEKIGLETIVKKLVDEKQWTVGRLKELIPSREETGIMKYFKRLLDTSNTEEKENQDSVMLEPQIEIPEKRSSTMDKGIMVVNGAIVKNFDVAEGMNKISSAIAKVQSSRKALVECKVRLAGLDALGDSFGIEMGMEGGEEDLASMVSQLKDAIDQLSAQIKEFNKGKDGLDLPADDLLKSDAILDKAEDEKGKGLKTLTELDKDEEEVGSSPEGATEEKKEEVEEKAASSITEEVKVAMSPTEGGKAVSMPEAKAEQPKGQGGDPMKATIEAKTSSASDTKSADSNLNIKEATEVLEKLKEKIATLAELKKEANLYPFKDLNKQEQEGRNGDDSKSQISEIDTDMKSGEMTKDKKDGFLGQNRDKGNQINDPGMDVSKEYNKAAAEELITRKEAAVSRKKSVDEALAKARMAMETASVQQLKGLLESPLKESIVKELVVAGMDPNTATAIVHNAFVENYEPSQRIVINEAFDTLAKQGLDEFAKVSQFTKTYAGEFSASVEDGNQVKTAQDKSSVNLRGSRVDNSNNGFDYLDFWCTTYAEQRGI